MLLLEWLTCYSVHNIESRRFPVMVMINISVPEVVLSVLGVAAHGSCVPERRPITEMTRPRHSDTKKKSNKFVSGCLWQTSFWLVTDGSRACMRLTGAPGWPCQL